MRNKKAIRILLKSYWGSEGWKEPDLSESDRSLLIQSGYLKDSVRLTHAECLAWALGVRGEVTRETVSRAFLYSLTTRHLEYRSALGSYAHLQHMPDHEFERADGFYTDVCKTCGYETATGRTLDFGVLNFERHKWGGVRHDDLAYMAYDLECLSRLEDVTPSDADLQTLMRVLELADSSPTVGRLQDGLTKVVKSNPAERSQLCEILAYAGILQPEDCPSFVESYVPWHRRRDGKPKSDQKFPLCWWSGHGCRRRAVRYWFPQIAGEL